MPVLDSRLSNSLAELVLAPCREQMPALQVRLRSILADAGSTGHSSGNRPDCSQFATNVGSRAWPAVTIASAGLATQLNIEWSRSSDTVPTRLNMDDESWGSAYGRGRLDRVYDRQMGLPPVRRVTVGPPNAGYDAGYDAELDLEKTLAGIKNREERRTPEQKASDTTFRLILAGIAATLALMTVLAVSLGPRIELVLKSQPWAASYYTAAVVAPLEFGNRLNNIVQTAAYGFRRTVVVVPDAIAGTLAKVIAGTVTALYALLILWLIYRIFWRIWWMRWVGLLLIIGPISLAVARNAMT